MPAVERTTKSISTSLPLNKYKALDDYHWTARKKLGEILTDAVDEYIVKHNITVEAEPEGNDAA